MTHISARSTVFAALPFLFGAALSDCASAQEAPEGVLTAEILSGWEEADGVQIAALRIGLAQGWKTYWRAPGDSGIPPHFDFTASQNVASVEVQWPRPEVFESAGARTVGYHDEMILPLRITPLRIGEDIALNAMIDMGICDQVCVPVQLQLDGELSGAGAKNPSIATAIAAAPLPRHGIADCSAEPIADGMRVTARIALAGAPDDIALFELTDKPVWISESQSRREGDHLISTAEFVPDAGAPFEINLAAVRLTILSGGEAFDVMGCAG